VIDISYLPKNQRLRKKNISSQKSRFRISRLHGSSREKRGCPDIYALCVYSQTADGKKSGFLPSISHRDGTAYPNFQKFSLISRILIK
jgi:hypothetical protein